MYGVTSKFSILGKSKIMPARSTDKDHTAVDSFSFERLATELHCDERLQDGTFNLTGMTGSLRFMAPGECHCLLHCVGASAEMESTFQSLTFHPSLLTFDLQRGVDETSVQFSM
jgi:hypothetical protein